MGNRSSKGKTKELRKGRGSSDATKTTVVPTGHKVAIIKLSPFSHVERLEGGMLVAHFGLAGLDQRDDIEHLFQQVRACIEQHQTSKARPILLYSPSETGTLSDVFAPNDPPGALLARVSVVWTVSTGGLDPFVQNAARIQQLLDQFQEISKLACTQWLYILSSPPAASIIPNQDVLVPLLQSYDVECRYPARDGSIVVEVTRPEGVVITALAGDRIASAESGPASYLQLLERVQHCKLPPVVEDGQPAPRDGNLRRLLLAVVDAERNDSGVDLDSAWDDVYKALLERRHPLLLMSTARGQISPMIWPGIGRAIPVFVDLLSFQCAVQDTTKLSGGGPIACAEMSVEKLSQWLLEIKVPPVLNVFKTRSEPIYLQPGLGALVGLAQGRVPTTSERRSLPDVARQIAPPE